MARLSWSNLEGWLVWHKEKLHLFIYLFEPRQFCICSVLRPLFACHTSSDPIIHSLHHSAHETRLNPSWMRGMFERARASDMLNVKHVENRSPVLCVCTVGYLQESWVDLVHRVLLSCSPSVIDRQGRVLSVRWCTIHHLLAMIEKHTKERFRSCTLLLSEMRCNRNKLLLSAFVSWHCVGAWFLYLGLLFLIRRPSAMVEMKSLVFLWIASICCPSSDKVHSQLSSPFDHGAVHGLLFSTPLSRDL